MSGVTLRSGDLVAGRYRIESLLGEGGFGLVYRAVQLPMERPVALKTLLISALAHGEGKARFRREAELAQRLEHPNTVRLYDFGETERGLPFIAWELLKGKPLDHVLAVEGRLPASRVARIAAQTLKSLMEAHGLGIVHRDIKPSNIFLCEFSGEADFVKVLDFGIAKNTTTGGAALTPEGSILGTPAYMAPEQVRSAGVYPATDLYALGVVMAELLTGTPVYGGSVALDVLRAQVASEPVPLAPEVLASPLGPIIARATQKAASARFASAAQMLAAVEALSAADLASVSTPRPQVNPEGATVLAMDAVPAMAVLQPEPPAPVGGPLPSVARLPPPPPLAAAMAATELGMPAAAAPAAVAVPAGPPLELPPEPSAPPAARPDASRFAQTVVRPPRGAVVAGKAAAPPSPRSGGLRAAIAVGAALAVVAVVVTGLVIRRARPSAVHAQATTSPVGAARHTNEQIRVKLEEKGRKVIEEKIVDAQTTQFVLAFAGHSVFVTRALDAKGAQAAEAAYLKQHGATGRDGTFVVHVDIPSVPNAQALVDHILH